MPEMPKLNRRESWQSLAISAIMAILAIRLSRVVLTAVLAASCNPPGSKPASPPPSRTPRDIEIPSSSSPPGKPSGLPASFEQELEFCVNETNRYRATLGLPPLVQSRELEAFAAEGARQDGLAHKPHHHFKTANTNFVATAENEIPWWPGSSVRSVIEQGLARMWAEGPGGGHYANMRGPYSRIGCGVFVNGTEITVVQNFR